MRVLRLATCALAVAVAATQAQEITLPNRADSVKFVAMGDMGTGEPAQYELARVMSAVHRRAPFDTVILLGDNLYGSQEPRDFVRKFEQPYRALLDAGVTFHAALGNHDRQENRFYPPWHMDGQRYYTFAKGNVRFFALDSDFLDPAQLKWLEQALERSTDEWKICFFHHPLYSDGGRHGSQVDIRVVLEPLFTKYGVNIVFSGHDHVYERLRPQKGIYYFVAGSAGQLRKGDLKRSSMTAAGYDEDQTFLLNEIAGREFHFEAVSRSRKVVDSGTLPLQR